MSSPSAGPWLDWALAKAICKGTQVAIDLNGSMAPVAVVTTLNTQVYCTEFGGLDVVKDGSDGKTFLHKNAPAPTSCAPAEDCSNAVDDDEDLEFVYVDPTVQNVPPSARYMPDGSAVVSRDELLAFIGEAMERVTTVHHGHMPEITLVDHDTAHGRWGLTNYFEYQASDGSLRWSRGIGHYHEIYVRTENGWRIRRSEFYRRDMDQPS